MTAPATVTSQTPVAAAAQPAPDVARPLRILLIEDSPSDARLTQERLRWSGITGGYPSWPGGRNLRRMRGQQAGVLSHLIRGSLNKGAPINKHAN